jgi:hypothetical protein
VSGWEHDRRGLPEAQTLFRIAKGLRCSIEELLEGIDRDYDAQSAHLFGLVFRDTLRLHRHEQPEEIPIIQEGDASPSGPTSDRDTGAYTVVLRCDSMEPLLKPGMSLMVCTVQAVADGDLAYVQLKSGERFVQIAARQDNGWLLSSANPSHAPRFVSNDRIESIHKVAYVTLLKKGGAAFE